MGISKIGFTAEDLRRNRTLPALADKALRAVAELTRKHIPVLNVVLDGRYATVHVRDCTAVRKLKSCHTMRGREKGMFVEQRVAIVQGCTVCWQRYSPTPFHDDGADRSNVH